MQPLIKKQIENGLGIFSICSSHPIVVEAACEFAMRKKRLLLIEATSNQVNQFGGYTDMKPKEFRDYVWKIAAQVGLERNSIILGGDHLGPNCWQQDPADVAMDKSEELISSYVEAGFNKIHLDASMSCADDPNLLDPIEIANRAARLCQVAEKSASAAQRKSLCYVIGTDVPIPGGGEYNLINKTYISSPESVRNTIECHQKAFKSLLLKDAFKRVLAVVVQSGAEFDNLNVIRYQSKKATSLKDTIELTPYVYEAHSTDYQTREDLKRMVQDRFMILKVGPALTFALREALFALADIEACLYPFNKCSQLKIVVQKVLLDDPKHWISYYGSKRDDHVQQLYYSFSDRIRYYWTNKDIAKSVNKLMDNLNKVEIQIFMLSQYLPIQYQKVIRGELSVDPKSLVKDKVISVLEDYDFACHP